MNRPDHGLSIDLEPLVEQVVARLRPLLNGEAHPVKRAFRAAEVAELLSISEREVRDLAVAGEIDSIRVGRVRLFPSSAIDKFIERKLGEGHA
jgi:excisionase family DNA binding protein